MINDAPCDLIEMVIKDLDFEQKIDAMMRDFLKVLLLNPVALRQLVIDLLQQIYVYMHDLREPHFSALKRILSVEVEYRGVANDVAETCWLRNLLLQHQRTKHIEIDIHFVRDLVAAGQVRVLHVPLRYQYADIFIKGLPSALLE
ncbi:ribonuclease H-like domain-containing protein [Tanacetum coccineum]